MGEDSGRVQPSALGLAAPDFILTNRLRARFAPVQVHYVVGVLRSTRRTTASILGARLYPDRLTPYPLRATTDR
jgi:hypothetical protein